MSKPSKSAITCSVLLFATVYATALQFYWGMAPYYGYDELWHTAIASISPPSLSLLLISADVHPPLHYLLLRLLTHALGAEPIIPRLASIIPTLLTLPLWFLLQRKLRIGTAAALTTTVILAISFSFHDIGIQVRSYSLATLLLLGALWFWTDLLPTPPGSHRKPPSRWSAVLSLALFTAAFWTIYVAVFVTASVMASTLLATAFDPRQRRALLDNWRWHSAWPEWLAFVFFHLLAIAWMWWGRHQHGTGGLTNHINGFLRAPEQPIPTYLLDGLRQQLALFTPLFDIATRWQNIGLELVTAVVAWLGISSSRRGNSAAAMLAYSALLFTALLATGGIFRVYPFGGEMRHQYLLFPLLLLVLALLINALWRRLGNRPARALLIIIVLGIAINTTMRSHRDHFYIGEAPPAPFWKDELAALFQHGSDSVVVTPAYTSYAVIMDRWRPGIHHRTGYRCDGDHCVAVPQGFAALLKPWPRFQLFSARADDGQPISILRYQDANLSTRPAAAFLDQLRGTLTAMGRSSARIFAADSDPSAAARATLDALLASHGFRLTGFTPIHNSVIWSIALRADTAPPISPQAPPATEHTP